MEVMYNFFRKAGIDSAEMKIYAEKGVSKKTKAFVEQYIQKSPFYQKLKNEGSRYLYKDEDLKNAS